MTKKKVKKEGIVSTIMGSWKVLLSIGLALSLISGVFTFDSRYYKSAEAQQQEQKYAQTIDQLNKNIGQQKQQNDLQFLQQDEKRLYDRERSLKRDLSKSPKDQSITDELQETQKDRDDVKKQIFDLKSKMR